MLRLYREADLDDVIEAWYAASLIAHPFLSEQFLAEERNNLRDIFLPRSETWVYEREGKVLGFISMLGNEIGGLFVHPNVQRQGVGAVLMDKAKALHKTLELEVFEANLQGRAFYNKVGFGPMKTYKDEKTGQMTIRLRFENRN